MYNSPCTIHPSTDGHRIMQMQPQALIAFGTTHNMQSLSLPGPHNPLWNVQPRFFGKGSFMDFTDDNTNIFAYPRPSANFSYMTGPRMTNNSILHSMMVSARWAMTMRMFRNDIVRNVEIFISLSEDSNTTYKIKNQEQETYRKFW